MLRRVLRRAVRYGQQILGAEAGFFAKLVPTVVATYGEAFPELVKNKKMIIEVLEEEEAAFSQMLTRGVKYFNDLVDGSEEKKSSSQVIKGDEAFFLYDSLGFPLDLTQLMAEEKGFEVDVEGFQQQMEEQVLVWSLPRGDCLQVVQLSSGGSMFYRHKFDIMGLAVSRDGSAIAASNSNNDDGAVLMLVCPKVQETGNPM